MIKNYWLSEFENKKHFTNAQDPDMDSPEEESDDEEEGPKSKLNDRQKMMYDHYEHLVEEFGKFDQTAKANGAHYAPASANPFIEEGLICANCVYFKGGQGCEIVAGKIEPEAVCKLWIIPQDLIKK